MEHLCAHFQTRLSPEQNSIFKNAFSRFRRDFYLLSPLRFHRELCFTVYNLTKKNLSIIAFSLKIQGQLQNKTLKSFITNILAPFHRSGVNFFYHPRFLVALSSRNANREGKKLVFVYAYDWKGPKRIGERNSVELSDRLRK